MKNRSLHMLAAACGSVALAVVVAHAAPTTRPASPTTKPATVLKTTADAVLIDKPAFGSKLLVPRNWVASKGYEGDILRYEMKGSATSPALASLMIQFHNAVESDKTPADDLAEFKERFAPKLQPEDKMVKNEATTLGGKPAWLFVYDQPPMKQAVIPGQPAAKPNAKQKALPGTRTMRILGVYNEARVALDFETTQPDFDTRAKSMQRVLDSYTWVDPADITIETAALKLTVSPKWELSAKADEWYAAELPFKGGQTYENKGFSAKLTMLSKKAAAGDTLDAAVNAIRKEQAAKPERKLGDAVDSSVNGAPAKTMVIDFVEHTGCGAAFPMKQQYTVAVKDGKVYHLVVTTTAQSWEKRQATFNALMANAQWAPAKAAMAD